MTETKHRIINYTVFICYRLKRRFDVFVYFIKGSKVLIKRIRVDFVISDSVFCQFRFLAPLSKVFRNFHVLLESQVSTDLWIYCLRACLHRTLQRFLEPLYFCELDSEAFKLDLPLQDFWVHQLF